MLAFRYKQQQQNNNNGSTRQGGRPRGPRCARRACGGAGASSFSRERCPMPGRGTNCRRRRYASAVPSTFHKSWKVGFARRCEARARARCARRAGGGAGGAARLPLREARARRGAPEPAPPAQRSLRRWVGHTVWSTRPRPRGTRRRSRPHRREPTSRGLARRAGPRLRGGGWCCTRCGAQCGAVCARPPAAGRFGLAWHAGEVRGDVVGARGRRAARARSFFGRWGALSAHAALRGPRARPSLSATRAL